MFIPREKLWETTEYLHAIPVGNNDCIYKHISWQARISARDARLFSPSTIQDLLACLFRLARTTCLVCLDIHRVIYRN
jgi:hypothetical protein